MSQRCLDCNEVLADDPADYGAITRCAKCQRQAVREQTAEHQREQRLDDERARERANRAGRLGTPDVAPAPTRSGSPDEARIDDDKPRRKG